MEASCKSLPIHTFLRGDRPTQEMANDANCVHINIALAFTGFSPNGILPCFPEKIPSRTISFLLLEQKLI